MLVRLNACVFFFQAEDGIRDLTVTGVQTCALPIWRAVDERARDLGQALELGVVLGHPSLGVVASRPGRDQELPAGRLQQQELARGLEIGRASCRERV